MNLWSISKLEVRSHWLLGLMMYGVMCLSQKCVCWKMFVLFPISIESSSDSILLTFVLIVAPALITYSLAEKLDKFDVLSFSLSAPILIVILCGYSLPSFWLSSFVESVSNIFYLKGSIFILSF